jgi:ATP-dependent DNA helicase RecG
MVDTQVIRESETVELKASLAELKAGLISIAAILNKHGDGELWFGIKNNGYAQGLTVTDKTLRDLSQAIAAHIEPKIYPNITQEQMAGKKCLKVCFSGNAGPYFAYGRAYMRVADEDRQLTAHELESLILHKNRHLLCWDRESYRGILKELNRKKVQQFVKHAGLAWDNLTNALTKLELLKDGQLLNAARLFFSKTPPLQLRCAVFAGTKSSHIIDRHDFDGDVLELIEEAQRYILKNIHIGMRLQGLYREDVPEISTAALREAIINAFCHRDYRDSDYIHIAIFKDRVEIRSPGGLYDGLTISKMRRGNISKRRNPLIADLFRRIQMVEAWGRGMPLILENEPGAQFREVAKIFIASFGRPSYIEKTEDTTNLVESGAQSGAQSDEILRILLRSPLSASELVGSLGLQSKTGAFKRTINDLLKKGLIEYTLPDKPNSRLQKYQLAAKGREFFEQSLEGRDRTPDAR